jgi:hypothetical protein
MRNVIVRYKVKPERAEENEQLIEAVFAELAQTTPEGLRYASFKGDDGITFFHFAIIEGDNPLDKSPAFQAFQDGIRDRCDVPPEPVPVQSIGAYRYLDS